ncbi:MAG: DUF488 domain-containing protein [Gammaproteobacteria bacterium]|nr:DUF488 domain-containing protein [Gammaproteobacteria bacterium]
MAKQNSLVWTIGHSTRPLDELIALLREHGITRLVDVRTVPRSAHNPQFNTETLPASLTAQGTAYTRLATLGGLRHARKDSVNTGWRNASFRGYADYMQTADFTRGLEELLALGGKETVAIMCAEAVPWRCHRSLIADALTVRGIEVRHIMGPGKWHAHKLTPFARLDGERITYPPISATAED